jgi:hypothetical protein
MRELLHILLFVVAVALPARAGATSAEGSALAVGPQAVAVLQAGDEADADSSSAPDLSGAYSSLYATEQDRKRNERNAFGMGIVGGLLGVLGGGLGSVITIGIGAIALPFSIALGAAWGVEPFFEARYGWMFTGALIGMSTAIPIVVGMERIMRTSAGLVDVLAVLFAVFASVVGPSAGATIAGITDQDNIERKGHAWKVAVAPVEGPSHDGVGLALRF